MCSLYPQRQNGREQGVFRKSEIAKLWSSATIPPYIGCRAIPYMLVESATSMPLSPEESSKPSTESLGFHAPASEVARAVAASAVKYLKTVIVTVSTTSADRVWEGKVVVFAVLNPPPKEVYVFPENGESGGKYVGVLGVYPIDSGLDAVRSWLNTRSGFQPE